MQKTSFNLGGNDRKSSPNAMKLNKMTSNAYVMKIILCDDIYVLYFMIKIPKIIHVKMLNNEEIVSFPHYLIVHHCNANDFELGDILIVH